MAVARIVGAARVPDLHRQRLEAGHAEGDEREPDLGVLNHQHRVVPPALVGLPLALDDEVEAHNRDCNDQSAGQQDGQQDELVAHADVPVGEQRAGDADEQNVAQQADGAVGAVHGAPGQAGVVARFRLPAIWPQGSYGPAVDGKEDDLGDVSEDEKERASLAEGHLPGFTATEDPQVKGNAREATQEESCGI